MKLLTHIKRLVYSYGQQQTSATPKRVDEAPPTFIEALKGYFEFRVTDNNLSSSTQRKYQYYYQNIKAFLEVKDLLELPLSQVSIPLCEELRIWLHKELKSCGKTHSSRHLEKCIAAMDYSVRRGWVQANPLSSLLTGRDKRKPVVYLDPGELRRFMLYNFKNEGFKKAQLLYTFQTASGLGYGNLYGYKTVMDAFGLWIEDNRNKVGEKPFYVPLDAPGFEIAKAIHEAYQGGLPHLENATYNRYLKEMAAILNIDKRLTTHTARKTFATLMDQEGFSLTVISAILGNTEEVCRDHYISASKKKIEKAIISQLNYFGPTGRVARA